MSVNVRRVHLTFPQERIVEPVIYNLAAKHNLVTNVRRAAIEEEFGWVVLEITGAHDDIEAGFAYLEGLGVEVDPVEGDVVEG